MSRSGRYVSQLQGYKAFIPSSLPPKPPLKVDKKLQKKLEQSKNLLARLDGMSDVMPNIDLFIAMYVKKEALLSSQIEGTQASLENVLEFEQGTISSSASNIDDIGEVVNYIKALNQGIKKLKKLPMSLRLVKELHAILLKGVRGKEKTPGEFKKTQNWIGPANCTLKDAIFVPPPPEEALKALGNLEVYIHKDTTYDDLINCALIHYQFETIHPFLDGNGRLGRLLITFYFIWKGVLQKPLLYLSYYFKKHRQEYYDRLNFTRNKGDYEQWVDFFLTGVIETAQSAIENTKKIVHLHDKHEKLLWKNKISSPLAVILLEKIFYHPIFSIGMIQKKLGVSFQSAVTLVQQFEDIGIIKEVTGKKRGKRYVYTQYLKILSEGTKPL